MSSDGVGAWSLLVMLVFFATAVAAVGALFVVAGVPLPMVAVPPIGPQAVTILAIALLGAIVGTIAVRGEPAPATPARHGGA